MNFYPATLQILFPYHMVIFPVVIGVVLLIEPRRFGDFMRGLYQLPVSRLGRPVRELHKPEANRKVTCKPAVIRKCQMIHIEVHRFEIIN
jgi:hypothetical protein